MRPILQEAVDALPDWWERIDSDPAWRKYGEYGLAAGYGLIALVALIQLVRLDLRVLVKPSALPALQSCQSESCQCPC